MHFEYSEACTERQEEQAQATGLRSRTFQKYDERFGLISIFSEAIQASVSERTKKSLDELENQVEFEVDFTDISDEEMN